MNPADAVDLLKKEYDKRSKVAKRQWIVQNAPELIEEYKKLLRQEEYLSLNLSRTFRCCLRKPWPHCLDWLLCEPSWKPGCCITLDFVAVTLPFVM
mgnify:CR=1 FL=1